jgi:hypothetical protein
MGKPLLIAATVLLLSNPPGQTMEGGNTWCSFMPGGGQDLVAMPNRAGIAIHNPQPNLNSEPGRSLALAAQAHRTRLTARRGRPGVMLNVKICV